ncbi:hypothetical protein BGW80DRAFT_1330443 [Lactifluus volemus]|nr:hypothetical protein BGW80DRAFT_1330443 [Lactifluus volemus]
MPPLRFDFTFDFTSSYSTLSNATPSTQTITPSYSTSDAASFGTPIPGPTLPVPVGGPVLSISSGTSTSSGQGTAVVSPIALNVAAVEGQNFQGPGRHKCNEPGCKASFTQKQVRNRHFKDQHSPRGTCPNCSWTWPSGRPGLLTAHQKKYHMPSVSDD